MIKITMKNVTSKIENIDNSIQSLINQKLTYTTQGFGEKSQTHYLFNQNNNTTYTGLIPHVISILRSINLQYEVIDLREKPEYNPKLKVNANFLARDYQQEIIDRSSSREILQAATGAGKTFIMAKLIEKYGVFPVVVIAPKVSLALQIQDEFKRFFNTEIGIIGGGYKNIQDVTICTPMSAPEEVLKNAKMLLYDEFHLCAAESIWETGIKAVNAYYRFGVSATPWREDGKDLLLEAIINKRKPNLSINASKLIDKGQLTPCVINFITIEQKFDWPGSYTSLYQQAIVNNKIRNKTIANLAIKKYLEGKTTLILIKNIKHGKELLGMISEKSSIPIEIISGEDNILVRKNILQNIKDGKTKILIASTIADEGLDCPNLDCLILAGGGRSSTRAFQRVGRVLRLYPGKELAEVYDFKDMTLTLYNHYLYRKALYSTEYNWIINEIDNNFL